MLAHQQSASMASGVRSTPLTATATDVRSLPEIPYVGSGGHCGGIACCRAGRRNDHPKGIGQGLGGNIVILIGNAGGEPDAVNTEIHEPVLDGNGISLTGIAERQIIAKSAVDDLINGQVVKNDSIVSAFVMIPILLAQCCQ